MASQETEPSCSPEEVRAGVRALNNMMLTLAAMFVGGSAFAVATKNLAFFVVLTLMFGHAELSGVVRKQLLLGQLDRTQYRRIRVLSWGGLLAALLVAIAVLR